MELGPNRTSNDECYSLHTIGSEGSLNEPDEPDVNTFDLESENVLKRYKELSIDLYTLPCYAAFSAGPLPQHFQYGDFSAAYGSQLQTQNKPYDWKPSFSGKWARQLLWQALWLAVLVYYLISLFPHTGLGASLPAILSSLLVWLTLTIVAAEERREGYNINTNTMTRVLYARSLRRHRWLVIYVLAPLLSVPLWTTRYLSVPSRFIWLRPNIDILTFSSWKDSARMFESALPSPNEYLFPNQDMPKWRDSWQTWRVIGNRSELRPSYDNLGGYGFGAPDTLYFTHPIIGNGFLSNYLSEWDSAVSGEIFMMPFFPVNEFDSETISVTIRTPLNMIAPSMECAILEQKKPWPIPDRILYNFKNCQISIKLENTTLDNEAREVLRQAYYDEIRETQLVAGSHRGNAAERLRTRLDRLSQESVVLAGEDELVVIRPLWIKTEHGTGEGNKACERNFIFIGDNQPFRRMDEIEIPINGLTIAYCESHFQTKDVMTLVELGQQSFVKRLRAMSSLPLRFLTRSAMRLTSGRAHEYRFWHFIYDLVTMPDGFGSETLWIKQHGEDARFLSQLLHDQMLPTICWNKLWPIHLLQYGRLDAQTDTNYDIASLALGSKMVATWFVEQLSETADMTLGRLVTESSTSKSNVKGLRRMKADLRKLHLKAGNFSYSRWFKAFILFVIYLCTRSVWSSYRYLNDRASGLPWSIETIAAKATLLVNSRLRTAFASSGHTPDEIRAIPGLSLGHWARKKDGSSYDWHLDTRCNQVIIDDNALSNESHRSTSLWERFSMKSLPAAAHPYLITTKLVFFLVLMVTAGLLMGKAKPGRIEHRYLSAVISSEMSIEPGWLATVIFMIFPQILIFSLLAWWHDLDLFYSARQPWVGLVPPRPAHLNITLNYMDCHWRFRKALANRHIPIVLLSIGSLIGFLLPLLATRVVQLQVDSKQSDVLKGEQRYFWDQEGIRAANFSLKLDIPVSAVNAILKPPAHIDWVIQDQALLPVVFEESLDQSLLQPGTFWQAQTRSVRSQLDCSLLSNSTIHYGNVEGRTGLQPQIIDVTLSGGMSFEGGIENIELESCGGAYSRRESSITPQPPNEFFCSQWILKNINTDLQSKPIPAWIITIVAGQLDIWDSVYGPLLNPGIMTRVLLCHPGAYIGTGIVKMLPDTKDGETRHIMAHSFDRQYEEALHYSIPWKFSHMLNDSIHSMNGDPSAFVIPQPFLESGSFLGDIMGLLLYRSILSHEINLKQLESLISTVFSTVFTSFVTESHWLKGNVTSHVDVKQFQWTEAFMVRKLTLSLLILILLFFLASSIYLGMVRKEYRFPISPEPLENALFFLYQSSIVDSLKSISDPEKLTIKTLHRKVEDLHHVYTFGRYQKNERHYVQFGVDRPEEFGFSGGEERHGSTEEQETIYRDDPADSEDSSDDSSEAFESEHDEDSDASVEHASEHSDDSVSRDEDASKLSSDDEQGHQNFRENTETEPTSTNEAATDEDGSICDGDTSKNTDLDIEGSKRLLKSSMSVRTANKSTRLAIVDFPEVNHLPDPKHNSDRAMGRSVTLSDFPNVQHLRDPAPSGGLNTKADPVVDERLDINKHSPTEQNLGSGTSNFLSKEHVPTQYDQPDLINSQDEELEMLLQDLALETGPLEYLQPNMTESLSRDSNAEPQVLSQAANFEHDNSRSLLEEGDETACHRANID